MSAIKMRNPSHGAPEAPRAAWLVKGEAQPSRLRDAVWKAIGGGEVLRKFVLRVDSGGDARVMLKALAPRLQDAVAKHGGRRGAAVDIYAEVARRLPHGKALTPPGAAGAIDKAVVDLFYRPQARDAKRGRHNADEDVGPRAKRPKTLEREDPADEGSVPEADELAAEAMAAVEAALDDAKPDVFESFFKQVKADQLHAIVDERILAGDGLKEAVRAAVADVFGVGDLPQHGGCFVSAAELAAELPALKAQHPGESNGATFERLLRQEYRAIFDEAYGLDELMQAAQADDLDEYGQSLVNALAARAADDWARVLGEEAD